MKTSKLTGLALDWAVAKCMGLTDYESPALFIYRPDWTPSTDWTQGGPIIEREKLCIDVGHDGVWLAFSRQNYEDDARYMHSGTTPLLAAMRCYVASKLGDEVEIPKELT
jgi:hypothetical protein